MNESIIKKRTVNILVVMLLVLSIMAILPTETTRAQPYSGNIRSADNEGNFRNEFALGSHMYFRVFFDNESSTDDSETLEVRTEDQTGGLESKTIETDTDGVNNSWEHDVYFELNEPLYSTGTYYLNISSPDGDYNNQTFQIYNPDYSAGSNVGTYDSAAHEEPRSHFLRNSWLYWNASIRDQNMYPPDDGTVMITTENDEGFSETESTHTLSPSDEGDISGSFWLNPGQYDLGDYWLNVTYQGDSGGPTVVASTVFNVYEPDYTQNSVINTYASSSYSETKNYFIEGNRLYYRGEIIDQYGWAYPNNGDEFDIWTEEVETAAEEWEDDANIDDGVLEGSFILQNWDYDKGDYDIYVEDGGTEYARNTFTIIGMELNFDPTPPFSQGQEFEIRIESNFPNRFDFKLENTTGAPLETWEDQTFTNDIWSAQYQIPDDTPDGTYYARVYSNDTGEQIYERAFDVRKFHVDLQTNKRDYIPGETLTAYYTVTNYLDATPAEDVTIDYRATYWDTDVGDTQSINGETDAGHFTFDIPTTADTNPPWWGPNDLHITVWANDTEGHHDRTDRNVRLSTLDTTFELDKSGPTPEYKTGQTIYVSVNSETSDLEEPVRNAKITVKLLKDGEVQTDYTTEAMTDQNGKVTVPVTLANDIEPGFYQVRVNSSKYDEWDRPVDQQIKVLDESETLNVKLETEKQDRDYYVGEHLVVDYTVTREGELVSDPTVKYRIEASDSGKVYAYDFASGGAQGQIEFDIPDDWNPEEEVEVMVWANLGNEVNGYNSISVDVEPGDIILNVDKQEYMPGDTVTFSYELLGIQNPKTVRYKVTDSYSGDYEIMKKGTPTGGEFTYTISQQPLSEYYGILEVVTSGNNTVDEYEQISASSGYRLEMEILTESTYQNNVYAPGQSMDVRYSVEALGGSVIPQSFTLNYGFLSGNSHSISTTDSTGTFTVDVPDKEDGEYFVQASALGASNIESFQVSRYEINTEIVTESQYTDGVYKPGKTLKVKYTVVPRGNYSVSDNITLNYGFITGETKELLNAGKEGSFKVTIPEDVEGQQNLQVWTGSSMDEKSVQVEKDPSWMKKKSPMTGLSQMGFIMFILLIIALVIGIMAMVLMKREPSTPAQESETTEYGESEEPSETEGEEEATWEEEESTDETWEEEPTSEHEWDEGTAEEPEPTEEDIFAEEEEDMLGPEEEE